MAPHPPRSTTAGQRRALVRPRLIRALDGRWDHRVTLLVAGAGFGKSILLSQLTDSSSEGVDVIVACGPDDNRAWVLATKVLAALGEDAPLVPQTDSVSSIDEACFVLSEAVLSRAPTPVALTFDDLHHLDAASEANAVLRRLIDDLPDNGHLVLSSRVVPELPLARLRSHQQVLQLGERDLAFDDDELRRLAEARQQPDRDLEATGGWPALAELA
ncbi:MAG TPA: hypothetical protein VJM33_19540, partial [Microthrixaceae bacterium]|nr:hypothetical protein [Microthrixaceae bacterium]